MCICVYIYIYKVLWEQSCQEMLKEGVKEFYEVSPMKQLRAMMKRIDAGAWKSMTNVEVYIYVCMYVYIYIYIYICIERER